MTSWHRMFLCPGSRTAGFALKPVPSPRLRSLQSRITELRRHTLPEAFDSTGTYSARKIDRARGFRILAHAEIESCLEDLVAQTVDTAFKGWWLDQRPRTTLVALVTFCGREYPAREALGAKSGPDMRARVTLAKNEFMRWVKTENHGIRERNVLKLLLPAGIGEHEIETAWLATIDGFGADRGSTAHQSANKPQTIPDPRSELETVKAILKGLAPIDRRLLQLQAE
jgi:hypothetical protein